MVGLNPERGIPVCFFLNQPVRVPGWTWLAGWVPAPPQETRNYAAAAAAAAKDPPAPGDNSSEQVPNAHPPNLPLSLELFGS